MALLKVLLPLTLAGLASNALAVTNYWINGGSGNWNQPTNWVSGALPGPTEDARVNNGGTALIDDSQTVNTGFAVMGDTNGTSGRLEMTGGRLVSSFDIRVGGNTAAGGGTGIFDQSGGVVFMNGGNLNVGFGTTAIGTYNLSGGSLQVNSGNIFAVGNRGHGTVNQSGGTIYVRGAATPGTAVTQLGRNTTTVPASGTYNLSGGTLASVQLQYGNAAGGIGSSNVFNLSGTGTLIVRSISVVNAGASNSFNFTGGNLIATTIGIPLNNNGGTFSPGLADFANAGATSIEAIPINPVATANFGVNDYHQGAGGTLAIDIADFGSNDVVNIGLPPPVPAPIGSATLAGTISVRLLNNFNPPAGTTFDVLTAWFVTNSASVTGTTADGYGFVSSIVPGADGRQVLRLTVALVPPRLINPIVLADGSFGFSFRSASGIAYVALSSTDITMKLSDWMETGTVTEVAPGEYQFTDSGPASDAQRFYVVQSQ